MFSTLRNWIVIDPDMTKPQFILDRYLNFLAALISGVSLAIAFRWVGDYPNSVDTFFSDNFKTVSLLPENYPGHLVLLTAIVLACIKPALAKIVIILWDGVTFSLISFTAVAMTLMWFQDIPMDMTISEGGPWLLTIATLLGAAVLYFYFIPFFMYNAFVKRDEFRWIMFGGSLAIIGFIVLKVYVQELVNWQIFGIIAIAIALMVFIVSKVKEAIS